MPAFIAYPLPDHPCNAQVMVVPVTQSVYAYAESIKAKLWDLGFFTDVDLTAETLPKKIRTAEIAQYVSAAHLLRYVGDCQRKLIMRPALAYVRTLSSSWDIARWRVTGELERRFPHADVRFLTRRPCTWLLSFLQRQCAKWPRGRQRER